ncbi:MAG: hypothetical protein ABIH37_01960 [archaeon]
MKCKGGQDINVGMAARIKSSGCKLLTAATTIITGECLSCGDKFQVPIVVKNAIIEE